MLGNHGDLAPFKIAVLPAVDEALWVKRVGAGEGVVADGGELLDLATVDRRRGEERKAAVAVLVVVYQGKNSRRKASASSKEAKRSGKLGLYLKYLLALSLGQGAPRAWTLAGRPW